MKCALKFTRQPDPNDDWTEPEVRYYKSIAKAVAGIGFTARTITKMRDTGCVHDRWVCERIEAIPF